MVLRVIMEKLHKLFTNLMSLTNLPIFFNSCEAVKMILYIGPKIVHIVRLFM